MRKDTKNSKKASTNHPNTKNNSNDDGDKTTNRPRNYYITDATSPYTFTFNRYGQQKSIVVHQTPNEETWPGGALWDIGVLMAKLLVQIMDPTSTTTTTRSSNRLGMGSWKEKRILELGCGVGLTGLVAAAMGARVTVLTDLTEVIQKVTIPNVEINAPNHNHKNKNVVAIPLCWGNEEQELQCATLLDTLAPPLLPKPTTTTTTKKKKKKSLIQQQQQQPTREGIPDVVLIGDVAYQHKPGAPSHFDILISTTLKFTDEHTIVIFGTRMRMPASADLLHLFKQYFDEIVQPPIEAHEIDPKHFSCGKKHNITIHFFKKRITK